MSSLAFFLCVVFRGFEMYTCLPLLSQAGNFSPAGCQPYLTIGVNGTRFGLKTFISQGGESVMNLLLFKDPSLLKVAQYLHAE